MKFSEYEFIFKITFKIADTNLLAVLLYIFSIRMGEIGEHVFNPCSE
jgi:hypothetical protein